MKVREQLERIPGLAAEVWLTRDAPNPDAEAGRHSLVFDTKPPRDVAITEALRSIDPDGWSETPLWFLTRSVRCAWEEIRDTGHDMATVPPLAEHPTYASEAAWLLATFDDWQACADEVALGYIEQGIGDCYHELARLAHEPRPVVLLCQVEGCGGQILPVPVLHGDRLVLHAEVCEYGHFIDRVAAVRSAERVAKMTIRDLAAEFGVSRSLLYRWRTEKRLRPVGSNDQGDQLFSREVVEGLVNLMRPARRKETA